MGIEVLVGAIITIGLYLFLAKSEDLEWDSRKKRFVDWTKTPEYKDWSYKRKGEK